MRTSGNRLLRYFAVPMAFILSCTGIGAQKLSSINTRWNDSFVEWEIYTFVPRDTTDAPEAEEEQDAEAPDEERTGELKQRWLNLREDWSEWDYQLGEEQGTVKVKWKGDPSQWELRSFDGHIITIRTVWPKDYNEWRITDNDVTLVLKSRWTNQLDEWLVQDNSHGRFYMYTLRRQDPRDWAIEDDLDETVSESMKMAMVFLAVFNGSPRL